MCVSDYILEELAKGQHVGAVLIDLKKAFDTVDHKILLKKLYCMGFRDVAFDWFESYLSNRLQCSVVGGKQSSTLEEGCFGVPQGSVLGPLLFLIYINDIFSCINPKSFCHLYADDTIIIQSAKNPLDLNVGLTSQLSSMSSWFYDNKLTVNTAKTEVIFFGRPNKVKSCKNITPITFQGSQIESTDKVKYLGVIFDEGMTWEDQANKARKNAYFNLNKINKIKNLIDDRIKHLLINALVFPHINYCLSSWGNAAKGSTKKFDTLLRSVDKILPIGKKFSNMTNYQRS
ncbi:MAG: reverse transcriptase family protein, partial [Cyanobacteria bacterium J06649_11]